MVETPHVQKKRLLASIFAPFCCHFFPHTVTWIGSEGFSERVIYLKDVENLWNLTLVVRLAGVGLFPVLNLCVIPTH